MAYSYAVDVSNNQASHQNWKSFGVHLGIVKASEGEHTKDAWFVRHLTDIKAAGLLRGAYHFAWPNQNVILEARNYIDAVKPYAAGGMVHILDLEPYPGGAKNYAGRTDAQIKNYATSWVAAVKTAFPGQRVLVYTPRDAVARHYPPNADGYWYPAYPVQNRTFAYAARLARPQVGALKVWGWQFCSEPRDQSVIYMDPATLRTWITGAKPVTPKPQEEDDVTAAEVWGYKIESEVDPKGPEFEAYRYLRGTNADVKSLSADVKALSVTVTALAATVTALVAKLEGTVSDGK